MEQLENSIGKEVYVLGGSVDTGVSIPLFVANWPRLLQVELEKTEADFCDGVKVVHGILTSALSIPNEVHPDTEIYIILQHASNAGSCILKVESLKQLQRVVTMLVDISPDFTAEDDGDEIVDFLYEIDVQDIDDIFVLYGYEIVLTYHFPQEALQVKLLEGGKQVYATIKDNQPSI